MSLSSRSSRRMTLIEVQRMAFPELKVEIEAIAAQ
jgi:enamine deaminase RidA (YjgF/YER057c/UK114 family)